MFPGRLTRYIMGQVAGGLLLALAIILAMTVVVDFVELSRTVGTRAQVSPLSLFYLALMRAPSFVEVTLPFIFLFGVMWSMFRLNRRSELVVMRAAGVSAWRFIGPAVALSLVLGAGATTVLNPAGARLTAEFERQRASLLASGQATIGVSEEGVWLREARADSQLVINAPRTEEGGRRLVSPTLYFYDLNGDAPPQFSRRIDAAEGVLRAGFWQLEDAWETDPDPDSLPIQHASIAIPTSHVAEGLLETLGAPETQSFWNLRRQARLLREAGFSASAYDLHWHQLLAMPLSLIAMTVVAAAASLRLARRGGAFQLAAIGAAVGFLLFFAKSFLAALATTGVMPIGLAAWAAPAFTLLGGLFIIATVEDG